MPTCDKCGKETVLRFKVMSEKWCEECYGPTQKHDFGGFQTSRPFDAYYDHALGTYCESYSDQERKVREYNELQRNLPPEKRDPQHPDGFSFINDNHKFMQAQKYMSRHGREYREQRRRNNAESRENWERKTYKPGKRLYFT